MDYGRLISAAWEMTWRYRFLWILGLFAPATLGSCSPGVSPPFGGQMPSIPSSGQPAAPDLDRFMAGAGTWLADHAGLIAAGIIVLALIGLVFLIISLIAQGGMASATIRLARSEATALGPAWREGRRFFWRFLGLWLLQIGIVIAVAALVAILFAIGAVAVAAAGGGSRVAVIAILLLIGIPLGLALIIAAILFVIAVAYAQREIVAAEVGPWTALVSGWGLTRSRLGSSLLIWLFSLGLTIGASIAIAFALIILLLILGVIGVIFWAAFGFGAPTIVYLILAALVTLAGIWLLDAINNTFFWSYWTLAYLRLREPSSGLGVTG